MHSCLSIKKSVRLKLFDSSVEYMFWQVLQLVVVQTPVNK